MRADEGRSRARGDVFAGMVINHQGEAPSGRRRGRAPSASDRERATDRGVEGGLVRRKDHEPPAATARWGWRYHHTGIPTTETRPGEEYLPHFKMYVSGFAESPYGIEWMRFEADSPV